MFFSKKTVAALLIILLVVFLLLVVLIPTQAVSWSGVVNSWNIHRQSSTLNLTYQDHFIGNITQVEVTPQGRVLGGYHSKFLKVNMNDVRLGEKTSALQGDIGGEENITLVSMAENSVSEEVTLTSDDPNYYVDYREHWPVSLKSRRTVGYSGRGINDIDFSGNNLDYMGSSSLYNHRYYNDRAFILNLERTNISVAVPKQTPEGFYGADLHFTKNSGLGMEIWSTGITELQYLQASPNSDGTKPHTEVEERFYGKYRLKSRIFMGSNESQLNPEDGWLDCCPASTYQEIYLDASKVFDCCQPQER